MTRDVRLVAPIEHSRVHLCTQAHILSGVRLDRRTRRMAFNRTMGVPAALPSAFVILGSWQQSPTEGVPGPMDESKVSVEGSGIAPGSDVSVKVILYGNWKPKRTTRLKRGQPTSTTCNCCARGPMSSWILGSCRWTTWPTSRKREKCAL